MLQAFATVARTASRRKISGARRALALPEVHRDSHAAVALVFQGFDLAESHADRKTSILTDGRLRLGGAAGARLFEGALDDRFQVFRGEA